jgi:BirA family biotin operon repressor/biotin-[acetyl-CoA-carboxylase] ligase|uniref:biotin--[biotin carboxyl-carrier protein] ligase n=1 Tax=uncultured gamma proteobacterium HF0130_25M15 TaxID=723568 RepID=E7C318_9GAMM|nr:biotin-(acetyl-CoA carboxylase) ligase [uncultured gamma proteobacterium HF0130_25M15]|tara:strand:- start:857 stop:1828 length:972 start_codon:yes stop_codon:yes gene_type:complete
MSVNNLLLKIINKNHEFKIRHEEIELELGRTISSDQAIDFFASIGISLIQSGESYEFRKIDFLDKDSIRKRIDQIEGSSNIQLAVEQIVETTSRFFSNEDIDKYEYSICFAEFQTKGRGRGENMWLSPYGSGICFSINGFLPYKSSPLGLSIYCGITIVGILRELGFEDVSLKWPNDLLHKGMKLGGILTELTSQSQDAENYAFNIGIGINYDLGSDLNSMEQNPFPPTDLMKIYDATYISRSEISGILAKTIIESLNKFNQNSMQESFKSWPEFDALHQKEIKIIDDEQILEGKNVGIDDTGALLLDESGVIKKIYNGHLVI